MTRARDLAAFVSNADGDIKFDTDTLFIDSSANRVGIGATSPTATLDLSNSSAIPSVTMGRTAFSTHGNLTIGGTGAGHLSSNTDKDGDSTVAVGASRMSLGNGTIEFLNSGSTSAGSARTFTERMRIQNDGIGIGLTTLTEKFEVNGSINSSNQSSNFTTGNYRMNMDIVDSLKLGRIGTVDGASTPSGTEGQVQLMVNASEVARLTADGLTFNGDTAAANALDDYEEGTWTASFGGATVSAPNTTGKYVKIGKMVHFSYYTGAATVSSASGGATITGLPFTADSNSYSYTAINIAHHTIFGDATVDGYVVQNNTQISFIDGGTSSAASYSNGSRYLMVSGVYISNA